MKRWGAVLLAAILLTGCGSKSASPKKTEKQIFAMDTIMSLTAYGESADAAVSEAEGQICALEKVLSRTRADSDVSRINTNGAAGTTNISFGVRELLPAAEEYRAATDGVFDITVASVVAAWGFTTDSYQVPEEQELEKLLPLIDGSLVRCEGADEAYTVTLGEGQAIDLGGIAKGYTSDLVEGIFRSNGIESGMISLGGNVFVCGGKPDGSAWRVGIQDPADGNALVGVISLRDAYAITSGGYQRYFEQDGKTYHHIIDPADGYPADSGLTSVTVVARANGEGFSGPGNGTMCDAFSTALFVMGEEKALEFRRNGGYEFDLILVTADGRVIVTGGLADGFEKTEGNGYTYETVA